MREKAVEHYLTQEILGLGGICVKFVSPSHRGVNDRLVILPQGRTVYVELKNDEGGRLSELQKVWRDSLLKLNQEYRLIASKKEVDDFVDELRASRQS